MKAKELQPGDIFCVDPPDVGSLIRVCITNDEESGLRFGWPSNPRFWCYMGEECRVQLVKDGPQSGEVEALQEKINRERSIRQDLLDASDRGEEPFEFTESPKGQDARDQWAKAYDNLNGAPESDDDR